MALAEDEFLVRLLVRDELESNGFIVLAAANGLDAIAIFDNPDEVNLLVTNVKMPGADGIDVAMAARAWYPQTPIMFISATPHQLTSARTPVPHHLISKPFHTENLVEMARELLQPS